MTDAASADILPGTLDLLILKAVSLGRLHGYGVLLRIEQISGGALQIQQGALYPALYRLEHQGLIAGEWQRQEGGRDRKQYRLTPEGLAVLEERAQAWERFAAAFLSLYVLAAMVGVGLLGGAAVVWFYDRWAA